VIGGHWGLIPKVAALALDNQIEAYNLPQGIISHLYRDIAAGKPGTISQVGLNTFVDPRLEGGKINAATTDDIVTLMDLAGEEYLFYRAHKINVALLRGTTADEAGNVTMEREALTLDNLAMAMAARNCGGLTIVQVERMAAAGSLNPRAVKIPAALVDAVVLARPENHMQTYATAYSPAFAAEIREPQGATKPMPLTIRKVIARRCALELPVNGVVNLGIGMPEGIGAVADEENFLQHVTLTAEPGVVGGRPAGGLDFGAAVNTDAIIDQNQQFDFYDGGGLDMACLGMAETDRAGNVNVSRFGNRLAGCGGFINISQNAKKVVFAGTFMAGKPEFAFDGTGLQILREGDTSKFVEGVGQVTFAAQRALKNRVEVLYVTERAVFRLGEDGIELAEVAPGLDLERDVLRHMKFAITADGVEPMRPEIFAEKPMGLGDLLIDLPLDARVALDREAGILFLNFEAMRVRNHMDVQNIRDIVETRIRGFSGRVDVIVNYDRFYLDPDIENDYQQMVRSLEDRYYRRVLRYSTGAFLRIKLGQTFRESSSPYIFENAREAEAFLRNNS
jgi:propionate CoA-transferase